MVDSRPSVIRTGAGAGVDSRAIDEGLRSYMSHVYSLMATAMVVSGALAYFMGMQLSGVLAGQQTLLPRELLISLYQAPMVYVLMFAPLGLVLLLSARIHAMSTSTSTMLFYLYSALVGISIATIFVVFSLGSIAQTFFATAVAFLGLSLYGYTTKSDLSAIGRFLVMALIGLIVLMSANWFIGSLTLGNVVIPALGILIFAGLTAYDTQAIKNNYLALANAGPEGQAVLEKGAVIGALNLYLNFLNMFLFLLQFMGAADE